MPGTSDQSRYKVLLVEDDAVFVEMWCGQAEKHGVDVHVARSAEEAVAHAPNVDAVILDWKLDTGDWRRANRTGGDVLDLIRGTHGDQTPLAALFTVHDSDAEVVGYLRKHGDDPRMAKIEKSSSSSPDEFSARFAKLRDWIRSHQASTAVPSSVFAALEPLLPEIGAWASAESAHEGRGDFFILLHGDPGAGKTTAAQSGVAAAIRAYTASSIVRPLDFSLLANGSEVIDSHVGTTERNIRAQVNRSDQLFLRGDAEGDRVLAVWYLDEIERLLPDRTGRDGELKGAFTSTMNTILDARVAAASAPFVLVATSNHLQKIDTALRDRARARVQVLLPNVDEVERALASLFRRSTDPARYPFYEMRDAADLNAVLHQHLRTIATRIVELKLGYRVVNEIGSYYDGRIRRGINPFVDDYLELLDGRSDHEPAPAPLGPPDPTVEDLVNDLYDSREFESARELREDWLTSTSRWEHWGVKYGRRGGKKARVHEQGSSESRAIIDGLLDRCKARTPNGRPSWANLVRGLIGTAHQDDDGVVKSLRERFRVLYWGSSKRRQTPPRA